MASNIVDTYYYYIAYNSSGDFYYGATVADTGSYAEGGNYWLGTYDNDGGYWQYYVYDSYDYGYDTGYDGYSAATSSYYYDAESGTYNSYYGYSNYGGLGSEYGYLSSGSGEYFGYYGYYEADA